MQAEYQPPPTRVSISRLIPLLSLAFAALGGLIYQAANAGPSDYATRLIASVGVLFALTISALYATRSWPTVIGSLTRFELGPWWVIKYFTIFGLASIAWVNPQPTSSPILRPEAIPLAVLVAAGGLVCWVTGYITGPPGVLSRACDRLIAWALPGEVWEFRSMNTPLLVYGLGISARLFQLTTGRYQYLSNPVFLLNNPTSLNQLISLTSGLARVGLILSVIQLVRYGGPRSKWIFRTLLAAEIVFALIGGMKEEFLMTFVVVVAVFGIARGRMTRVGVIVALVGLLLIFPINVRYREFVRGNGIGSVTPGQAIAGLPEVLVSSFTDFSLRETSSFSFESGVGRARNIDNLAIIVQKSPEVVPFEGWSRVFIAPITSSVPRFIWRNKPVIAAGYDFNIDYWEAPPTLYTSRAVTLPGDLYRYEGWWTLAVGMFLMGSVARLAMMSTYRRDDLRFVVMYVPLLLLLTALENDYPSSLVGIAETFILLVGICRFSFVPLRSSPLDRA